MNHNRRSVLKLLGLAPVVPGLFREAVAYRPFVWLHDMKTWFIMPPARYVGIKMPRELMEDDLNG